MFPTFFVTVLSAIKFRVTFDQGMVNNAALSDPTSYNVTPQDGGVGVVATFVTPEAVAEPTYVEVDCTEMTDGAVYRLQLVPGIVSAAMGFPAIGYDDFTGQGVAPQVSGAQAVNSNKVRVTFDEPMDYNGDELTNPDNYQIAQIDPGAVAVVVNEVETYGTTPSYVDLVTSEMTDGKAYQVEVDSSGPIRDAAYNPLDAGSSTAGFTGTGQLPEVSKVEAVSEFRVDVTFTETMLDNSDLRDPSSYQWDLGLETADVLDFTEGNKVKLVVRQTADPGSGMVPGQLYTLTIP